MSLTVDQLQALARIASNGGSFSSVSVHPYSGDATAFGGRTFVIIAPDGLVKYGA